MSKIRPFFEDLLRRLQPIFLHTVFVLLVIGIFLIVGLVISLMEYIFSYHEEISQILGMAKKTDLWLVYGLLILLAFHLFSMTLIFLASEIWQSIIQYFKGKTNNNTGGE